MFRWINSDTATLCTGLCLGAMTFPSIHRNHINLKVESEQLYQEFKFALNDQPDYPIKAYSEVYHLLGPSMPDAVYVEEETEDKLKIRCLKSDACAHLAYMMTKAKGQSDAKFHTVKLDSDTITVSVPSSTVR